MSDGESEKKKSVHQSQLENEERASPNPENENQDNDGNSREESPENENKDKENEVEDGDDNKKKNELFNYFEDTNDEIIENDKHFEGHEGKYKYSICILMKDDEMKSSEILYKTLTGIRLNLKSLEEKLDIKSESICIFIFINRLYKENIFNEKDMNKLEENLQNSKDNYNFLLKQRKFKEDNELKDVTIYTIANKYDYCLCDVTALKLYYLFFLNKLHKRKQIMFSSVITAGVIPVPDSLIKLIQYSFNEKSKHAIAVAPIEYKPNKLYNKISLYEKIHFNIYNMSFYCQSYTVPVSSLLCTMTIDGNLMKFLTEYYQKKIEETASIDFHDYNLGLRLIRENHRKVLVKYNYDNALGIIDYNEMTFLDYQKEFVNRYSGYYGNSLEILRAFADCNMCNLSEKIFLIFQIIAICIEFILPSLASMVIYTVFHEAFATYDYRIALFFTALYLCMMFTSGVCSLISKDPNRMKMTNYFLYFFMEIFYLLVLICSVPAMHYVNKNKIQDYISDYKFNKAAAAILIMFSFIVYVIPMFLKVSNISNNIVPMILYLFLASPCSTTIFNMAKIWNAPDTAGGNKIESLKSIHIIMYLLFNLFFGSLSFYNLGRKKRVNCVMGFGILFFIYSFFRTMAIIMKLVCNKEEYLENKKVLNNIKIKLNEEVEDNEDIASEEKKIKKNEEENIGNNNDDENNEEQNNNEEYNNSQNASEKQNEEAI